jgi:hypothetical protein
MDELKSVRVRRKLASLDERHGSLDIKVTIYKGIGKKRIVKGFNNGTAVWPEAIYDGEIIRALEDLNDQYKDQGITLSSVEDDCIKDFIRVNTLRERPTGATVSVFNSNTGKQESANYYTIVQDPWSDTVPAQRSFGFDPYYLSNGSEVYIKWLTESYDKISYDISGMTASITASGSSSSVTKIVVDVYTNNSSKYPDFDLKFDYNGGSQSEIDAAVLNVTNQSINTGFFINGITYSKEGENIPSSLTYLMNGGEQYSDLNMKEINTPKNIIKRVEVIPPRDSNGGLTDKIWTLSDNNEFKYVSDILSDPNLKQKTYLYSDKDEYIIKNLIDSWVTQVPIYKSQAALVGVGLMLCNPSYQSCLYTKYQSPLKEPEPEIKPTTSTPISGSPSTTKTKLSVVFPTEFEVKVREDVPPFKIYIGEPPVEEEGSGFIFQDEDVDAELSPEYQELAFRGDEEQIDFNLNLETGDSEGQEEESSTTTTTPANADSTQGDVQVSKKTATDSATQGGGSGDRRFQQKLTVGGNSVKNGELPDSLLAKCDFIGHRLEKNAVKKLNELNKAFKAEFGHNIKITDGYRTFNVQNQIFDWKYYDTSLNPYSGKSDLPGVKNKGRKKDSFTSKKPMGVAAAKPGTSKHGWGQAIDCDGFGNGPGNKYFDWMEANAKKYGWINPAWAKKAGAGYEPWHFEYNGSDLFKP